MTRRIHSSMTKESLKQATNFGVFQMSKRIHS